MFTAEVGFPGMSRHQAGISSSPHSDTAQWETSHDYNPTFRRVQRSASDRETEPHFTSVDPAELTNLAVRKLDPAARETAVDTLVDEMTRADDMTRPESMSAGTSSA